MKRKIIPLLLAGICSLSITACNISKDSSSQQVSNKSSLTTSPYSIKITAIGSTTIMTSKTLSLRTAVVGTNEKDLTWSSSNESVATVSNKGVVTGVNVGKATITATLVLDTNCKASIEITVEKAPNPTSIAIINPFTNNTAWVGENVQLSSVVEPENASNLVQWSTSNESVASISGQGLVSFNDIGSVVITATSKVDSNISGTLSLTVKKGAFLSNLGSPSWNYAHQSDETNPYIDIDDSNDDNSSGIHPAYFAVEASTKFYTEAYFKVKKLTSDTWNWQGFGVGTGLSNNDLRVFSYSPHSPVEVNNNHNKIILRDIPTEWGTGLTNRSQVWGEHNLNDFTLTDTIKIGMLRNENEYYYLINDELYWYDNSDKYDGIATKPMLFTYDIPIIISNYKVEVDTEFINDKINSEEFNKSFFAAYNNVEYENDSNFTLTSTATLSKDHKVRSIGDKAKVVKNFEVEFDVDNMSFNSDKSCHKGLTINFSRYDNADIVDTVSIGRSAEQENGNAIIGRFTKWDYPTNMENPNSIKEWFETTSIVKSDSKSKSHVKIVREINELEEKSYFRLFVDNIEYNFDLGKTGIASGATSVYTGAYLIWVAGEYSSCHISNFVFRSNVNIGE